MINLDLTEKRALVTGSSSGIGEGIAKALALAGATVVVHGRDQERTNRVAQEITDVGGKAFIAIGDLATNEGARNVADKALSYLGGVDILINNAGTFINRKWMELSPDQWATTYNNNVISIVRMILLIAPQMKQLGWGRIINISSSGGTLPTGTVLPDYSASKAAIINMTVGLAKELAGTGITVNAVSPGDVDTPGAKSFQASLMATPVESVGWEQIEERLLKAGYSKPSGRLGRVEDVANLVAFLASPLTGWINGTNFHIDGGTMGTVS